MESCTIEIIILVVNTSNSFRLIDGMVSLEMEMLLMEAELLSLAPPSKRILESPLLVLRTVTPPIEVSEIELLLVENSNFERESVTFPSKLC